MHDFVYWDPIHQRLQVPKTGVPYLKKAVLGVGFPLHKPYIHLIYVNISILGS